MRLRRRPRADLSENDIASQDIESFSELRLERAVDRLTKEFQGIWSRETIDRFVHQCRDELEQQVDARGGGSMNFAGLHAHRFARERLWALAQVEGRVEKTKPEVLFVCVRNAGRSQMAAALTHKLSGGAVGVRSAGSLPGEEIHPIVVAAMREVGVDVNQEFPKPLSDEVVRAADVVVTMGCGDACTVYPGKRYEDWEVADPEDQPLETVRAVREDIARRVQLLLDSLVVAGNSA